MTRISWLAVLASIFVGTAWQTAHAQDKAKAAYDKMEAKVLMSNTYQVEFDIAVVDSIGVLTEASQKGRLYVAKENKVHLSIDAGKAKLSPLKGSLLVSDGVKALDAVSGQAPAIGDTPKQLANDLLTALMRVGFWASANTVDVEDIKVAEFKLGKKEKVAGKEAQAVTYKLIDKNDKKLAWAVTVWIDTKTNLPLKRVLTSKEGKDTLKVTETYTNSVLDVPIDAKYFEFPYREISRINLKNIGVAMQNHHNASERYPAAAICDKNGKPLLSWRVALLPYLEAKDVYKEFKLDQPWNSNHNKKLIAKMPAVYAAPPASNKPGETHYRVLVGGGAGFEWSRGLALKEITDGTSNTIAVVEAADSVPWTKPDELIYDAKKLLPKFANFHGDGTFSALFFDGRVATLKHTLKEATLRALITRAAGDMPGEDYEP